MRGSALPAIRRQPSRAPCGKPDRPGAERRIVSVPGPLREFCFRRWSSPASAGRRSAVGGLSPFPPPSTYPVPGLTHGNQESGGRRARCELGRLTNALAQ